MRAYQLQVPGSAEGKSRLDVYLVEAVPDVTRARLQGCIKEGLVTVNGTPRGKPGFKVKAGDQVEFTLQPLKPLNAEPEDIPLDIVYEDEQLLVINKASASSPYTSRVNVDDMGVLLSIPSPNNNYLVFACLFAGAWHGHPSCPWQLQRDSSKRSVEPLQSPASRVGL
jgi:ribosomal 50S subunit-recycling heat shock protein